MNNRKFKKKQNKGQVCKKRRHIYVMSHDYKFWMEQRKGNLINENWRCLCFCEFYWFILISGWIAPVAASLNIWISNILTSQQTPRQPATILRAAVVASILIDIYWDRTILHYKAKIVRVLIVRMRALSQVMFSRFNLVLNEETLFLRILWAF